MSAIIINNKLQNGHGQEFVSRNPANQDVIWHGKMADVADVNAAIAAARQAFNGWSLLSFEERAAYIEQYISVLKQHTDEYAEVIHQESGKPLWEAKTEVATMVAKFQSSVNSYHARTGAVVNAGAISSKLEHRAIGVMTVFGPFNFPGHLPNGHIIPALLAGNTVVFKPSELTPLCGELMVKYFIEANLPPGVINLVQGDSETGKAIIANHDINGVLFTGSYRVGKLIHAALAGRPEIITALEMGGNNPLIIDSDINDISAAVYHTIQSAFITAGQRCTCARRLYLPKTALGKIFLDKLIEVTNNLVISDGINHINLESHAEPFMGAVISLTSKHNILKFKNDLLDKQHAIELVEAKSITDNSALITPGIVLMPTLNMVFNEQTDAECFGPILQVYQYEHLDEAIIAANNTQYGLAAGFFSDNQANFDKFYKLIRAGIVNWNRPTTGAAGTLPFGGIGHSGNYRPGAFYAADYCAYPMASQYSENLSLPKEFTPGIII
jgi:succinylglutamic semialdehyde dehydrogenase